MIHIACAADDAYVAHCAAMIRSFLEVHAESGAAVHFLHGEGISKARVGALERMTGDAGGVFYSHLVPQDWVRGLPRLKQIPEEMWFRVFLPGLLPNLDRILYLDCDTLVVDDLTGLWNTGLEDTYVAAVRNIFEPHLREWPMTLGLADSSRYFNSGVLLLNLDLIRRDAKTEELVDLVRQGKRVLKWPDQDALNIVFSPGFKPLHPRWNCQNNFFYNPESREIFGADLIDEATSKPAIIHFEGGNIVKPWHYLSRHPYTKLYFEMRAKTPWPDVHIEGKNLLNRLLKSLPVSWSIRILTLVYRVRRRLGLLK